VLVLVGAALLLAAIPARYVRRCVPLQRSVAK
jgi:hypothetical protein